jgi:Ca2+-binding EF-hand superfamily protein
MVLLSNTRWNVVAAFVFLLLAWMLFGGPRAAGAERQAADPRGGGREATFHDRDADRDGRLTAEEYGGQAGNFSGLDTDGDGWLSLDEFLDRGRMRMSGDFSSLDVNGDGFLGRREWRGARSTFKFLDRNRDGKVSRAEFSDRTAAAELFRSMDRDGNGELEKREWREGHGSFAELDLDESGSLSRAEFLREGRFPGEGNARQER